MTLTIYHNPRCSKSRAALALLEERGLEPAVVHYLDSPLNAAEISALLSVLALKPRALLRTGEEAYKVLNLADRSYSDRDLIEAMVKNPILIQRPIVVNGDKAVIARPPEAVLEIV